MLKKKKETLVQGCLSYDSLTKFMFIMTGSGVKSLFTLYSDHSKPCQKDFLKITEI